MASGAVGGASAGGGFNLGLGRALWIVVLSLVGAGPAPAQVGDPGSVVQTIDTSLWSPPSPDPSGIAYRPDTGELITCDAEVEEMAIFAGVNLWTHSVGGTVSSTASTTAYSNEPTGIAWDPAGGRVWISDDIADLVFEFEFGPDGLWNTPDDVEFELDRYTDAGCDDLEDVTYDNVHDGLFLAGGGISGICRVQPGLNGLFDGAPPAGDDVVTIFDVALHGIDDPEGIVYDPFWDTLVVADRHSRDLWELTPGGALLRRIDVDFPGGVKISGVTIAPGSTNPMLRSYWVTDRRADNGDDPFENDGRIYEVVALPLGGNGPPIVEAGPPQNIFWPTDTVDLSGFVSDDGHPYPPSVVASLWSALSGPGSVDFGDASSPVTTATFSEPGQYLLQLEGDDSDEQTIDTVAIDVTAIHTLSVLVNGAGSVGVDPAAGPHPDGSAVTLTAQPGGSSWRFAAWSGDAGGTANPLVLVMDADKSVTAIFQPKGGWGGGGCGIGPELFATLPLLLWLRRRQRRA